MTEPIGIRVLHLSSESTWRGGEQQIIYLVEESRKLGVDAIIACKANSSVEKYCQKNNLPFESLVFKSAYDLSSAFKLKKICKKLRIDLIQTHTSKSHTLAVIAGLLGLNITQILTRRVDFPIKDNWFSRFKYNYRKIVRVVCISETIHRITAVDIKDQSKLVTIHSGVDLSRFQAHSDSDWLRQQFQLSKETVIIGNTSAVSDQKDYRTWVEVAKRVLIENKNVHFFIIGDGPDRKFIEGLVSSYGLQGSITFTGFVGNIHEVLPSLDIFLFTSQTEGLGTSVLDAMAAGVPIVCTNAGGVSEMIEHEANGLMYPVKDIKGLMEGVLRYINDPTYSKTLAEKASETVKNFSKQKTAALTVSLYQELLKEKATQ